jgi:ribosomal protein S25
MPTIPCEVCKGSGRVPLPAALQEVLDAVNQGLNTAPAIWSHTSDRANIGVTAINRRLERLTELGFVTRSKGPKRSNIYTPTKRKHHGRRSSKT